MAKYISKRILIMIPTILFVVFIIFYILHFMPSSPGRIILGVNAKELVLVMLPTLILYICVQRQLTQGMTVGGLKG